MLNLCEECEAAAVGDLAAISRPLISGLHSGQPL